VRRGNARHRRCRRHRRRLLLGLHADLRNGELDGELAEAHALCLEAQLAGLSAVRPGVSGRDADAASREPIEAAGLGWAYGHGLGHGVGIEVHEAPVLRPESQDVLEPGNTVTVETGIYLPGEGGGGI